MRVTVCELPDDVDTFAAAWTELRTFQQSGPADLLILNEVPFDSWFGSTSSFEEARWTTAVERHQQHIADLADLCTAVIGTAPVNDGDRRYNRAFVWMPDSGVHWWRRKAWIPDEDPVYEASWYDAAPDPPDTRTILQADVGVLTCTELWAMDWAAELGRGGAHIIASPRATGTTSTDKWIAAGRVAATISGAYSVSSNRVGNGFGGTGWIISPDGDVLGQTSRDTPIVTVDIDIQSADRAKQTYPRYALWNERWNRAAP